MSDDVRQTLMAFLDRKSVPSRLKADQAMADEIRALVQALHRAAPVDRPSREWVEDFLGHVERREKAPVWPAVKDIEAVAAERRKHQPPAEVVVQVSSSLEIDARRIADDEPVAEGALWGPPALYAWRNGIATPDQIQTRRARALAANADIYGQAAAEVWLSQMQARWAATKQDEGAPRPMAQRRAVVRELLEWARDRVSERGGL